MVRTFGGPWTILKLHVIEDYLRSFTTALKNSRFTRIYIDAFAGSGDLSLKVAEAPLLESKRQLDVYAGSARRALAISPPFEKLYFIDADRRNVQALQKLADADEANRAVVSHGDANTEVLKICNATNWRRTRGVLFLDPFGNEVEWATLEKIATKTKLDVWYLFPLSSLYRNAPINRDKLTPDKRTTTTKILGTAKWEEAFYRAPPAPGTLFDLPGTSRLQRTLNVDGIEDFVKRRLAAVFPLVLGPKRLYGPRKASLFRLFFALSSDSPKAKALAMRILKRL